MRPWGLNSVYLFWRYHPDSLKKQFPDYISGGLSGFKTNREDIQRALLGVVRKALDRAKELLRQAFQKVGESDPETCEIRVYPSEGRIEIKYTRTGGEMGKAVEDIANEIMWLHYRCSFKGESIYVTEKSESQDSQVHQPGGPASEALPGR